MDELTTQTAVKCSEEQLELWKQAAALDERPLAQWIRVMLTKLAKQAIAESEDEK